MKKTVLTQSPSGFLVFFCFVSYECFYESFCCDMKLEIFLAALMLAFFLYSRTLHSLLHSNYSCFVSLFSDDAVQGIAFQVCYVILVTTPLNI